MRNVPFSRYANAQVLTRSETVALLGIGKVPL